MARPKADISPTTLEQLGRISATLEDAALFLGVTERTVRNRLKTDADLRDAWEKGRATGRISLRRKQMEVAMSGNPTLLIWMGKQLLGQREPERVEPAQGQGDAQARLVRDTVKAMIDIEFGPARDQEVPGG